MGWVMGMWDAAGMDEVVTYDEVSKWLPRDIRDELVMALPPEQRGWWTAEEAAADGRNFVEVTRFGDRDSRFLLGRN
jgi:hypothetical protein